MSAIKQCIQNAYKNSYGECEQPEIVKAAHEELTRFQNLAKAAKRWRKYWVDAEDILGSQGDCDCDICVLIRATEQSEEE